MALETGLLEQILAELKKLNANLEQVQPTPQYGINTARLISLAKTDPPGSNCRG